MNRNPPAYEAKGATSGVVGVDLPPLVEMAAALTRELGLKPDPPGSLTEVISAACKMLGTGQDLEGLLPKAKACYIGVFGTSPPPPTQAVPSVGPTYLGLADINPEIKYAIKSVSSGNYLDGRGPEHLGNEVFMTQRPPKTDRFLHWQFEHMGGDIWAIKSFSSSNYLDGRNPDHVGDTLFLTRRRPRGDAYLHWRLERHGPHVTLRSVSSGNCLDGRNPGHLGGHMVLMTSTRSGRNPATDKYLQWTLEPM